MSRFRRLVTNPSRGPGASGGSGFMDPWITVTQCIPFAGTLELMRNVYFALNKSWIQSSNFTRRNYHLLLNLISGRASPAPAPGTSTRCGVMINNNVLLCELCEIVNIFIEKSRHWYWIWYFQCAEVQLPRGPGGCQVSLNFTGTIKLFNDFWSGELLCGSSTARASGPAASWKPFC